MNPSNFNGENNGQTINTKWYTEGVSCQTLKMHRKEKCDILLEHLKARLEDILSFCHFLFNFDELLASFVWFLK